MIKFNKGFETVTVSIDLIKRWYCHLAVIHFIGGIAAGVALVKLVDWWVYPVYTLIFIAGVGAGFALFMVERISDWSKRDAAKGASEDEQ